MCGSFDAPTIILVYHVNSAFYTCRLLENAKHIHVHSYVLIFDVTHSFEVLVCEGFMYMFILCTFPQIRDQLPELKAIVQYKGKLAQTYPDVYEVSTSYYNYVIILMCCAISI